MSKQSLALSFLIAFSASALLASGAKAGIEQLLIDNPPIPTQRPNVNKPSVSEPSVQPRIPKSNLNVQAVSGTLKSGLEAISKKQPVRALQIREGMTAGSLDRKILAWAIALSGQRGIPSSEILSIANDLKGWPGQKGMLANAEKAFANEKHSASTIVQAFQQSRPETIEGAILIAKTHLARSNRNAARKTILPFWREDRLNEKIEKRILSELGSVLTAEDHRIRMHQQFYNGRIDAGKRMGALAKQYSLSKAWAAVLQNSSNASALINAVAPASRKDVGFQFVQIEYARRKGEYRKASNMLLAAPRDARLLVDPDEWWNERRIVSREMLELGDAKTAYRIASQHSATSPAKIAEAEFHAGWYALRFLNDAPTARRHFQRILDVTSRPISQSRGYYWMGRASSGNSARQYFQKAAAFTGTYYGQLAADKLGTKRLSVSRPKPTQQERNRFASREMVQAIKRLEAIGYEWRADSLYRQLARTLTSPGELAILSARAERKGDNTLALQIGKLANTRGLDVDTLTWPIGAIPKSAKTGKAGLPLAYAIARQESAFDVGARSPADARGLLQLLPRTAQAVAKRNGLKYSARRLISDGGYNATLGSAYLGEQLAEFDNSYILTFAAYNAGPRRAREWVSRFGNPKGKSIDDVVDWVELISFTETRNYVQRVMENYQVYKRRINGDNLSIVSNLRYGRR